jgi:hypothetical protein
MHIAMNDRQKPRPRVHFCEGVRDGCDGGRGRRVRRSFLCGWIRKDSGNCRAIFSFEGKPREDPDEFDEDPEQIEGARETVMVGVGRETGAV